MTSEYEEARHSRAMSLYVYSPNKQNGDDNNLINNTRLVRQNVWQFALIIYAHLCLYKI